MHLRIVNGCGVITFNSKESMLEAEATLKSKYFCIKILLN